MLSRNHLPNCYSNAITKSGRSLNGIQRYRCQHSDCPTQTFMLKYRYKAYEPGIKAQIVDMAINSSGIRDTARVLKINKNTVINTLKRKEASTQSILFCHIYMTCLWASKIKFTRHNKHD